MRHWVLLLLFSMALSVHAGGASASFDGPSSKEDGAEARWSKKSLRVRLDLEPGFENADAVRKALSSAILLWNSADARAPRMLFAGNGRIGGALADIEIRFASSDEDLALFSGDDSESVALTRLFASSSGNLRRAVIVINPFTVFDSDGTDSNYSFEKVIAHELGHALGLSHSSALSSLMFAHTLPSRYSKSSSPELTEDDMSNLRGLYGGGQACCVSLSGSIVAANGTDFSGYQVVVESLIDSRLIAVKRVAPDGVFRVGGLKSGEFGLRILDSNSVIVGVLDVLLTESASDNSGLTELEPIFVVPRGIERSAFIGTEDWLSTASIESDGFGDIEFNLGFRGRGPLPGTLFGHFGGLFADLTSEMSLDSNDWVIWKVRAELGNRKVPAGEYSFYIDGDGFSLMIPGALRVRNNPVKAELDR
jgi:hypothetical protein